MKKPYKENLSGVGLSLLSLPLDILHSIKYYLSFKDVLLNVTLINKEFCNLIFLKHYCTNNLVVRGDRILLLFDNEQYKKPTLKNSHELKGSVFLIFDRIKINVDSCTKTNYNKT